MENALRVLLVDDHRLFRAGLRLVLEREPGFSVVGEAASSAEALAILETAGPDVALVDFHLPDNEDGVVLAHALRQRRPDLIVLFLSSEMDPAVVRRALAIGASGYLLKDSAAEELIHAIHAVRRGGLFLSPALAVVLRSPALAAPEPDCDPAGPELAPRELEVLRHVSEGLRNKEIADRLNISIKSVETYRSRLMKKLGYESTAELVRYAIRIGLVEA